MEAATAQLDVIETHSLSTATELTQALLAAYREAGEQTGYWGRRFYQKLNRVGGLNAVKDMLTPRTAAQRTGLDALLAAGRPDLTVEAIASSTRFRNLFNEAELAQANERLKGFRKQVEKLEKKREHLFPDDLPTTHMFPSGARKSVRVNAFERDDRARAACIAHHGAKCAVCEFDFGKAFGAVGQGFIHVHHITPVSTIQDPSYQIDARRDLVPVCPNCHAMLHYRTKQPRPVKALKALLRAR